MSRELIKVAVVEPVGGHGGCHYYDISLCRSLQNFGFDPTLYTCDETEVTGDEGIPIDLVYKGIYGKAPSWQRGLLFLKASIATLTRARFSGTKIAHFHFYHVGFLELFNVLFAKLLLLKIVITAHDVEAFKEGLSIKLFVKWAYGLANAVIAHNQISRQELLDKVRLPENLIHVIPHGNHIDYVRHNLTRANACSALGISEKDFVIVFFGQIKEVKGVDLLLKAMPTVLNNSSQKIRLVIAGRVWKDDFTKYQKLIDELDLADNISLFIRYISDEELPNFYCAANIMVLPYTRIYQSGVVLMAMTFGKAVLVSNIPGMLEVVTDKKNGLVFETENIESLSEQILWSINNIEALDVIAQSGQDLMFTDYSWEKVGQLTTKLYRQILST
ncbi:glycosyltransferase family 4 protein [Ampullimonas aquatilis]|uniref:glycosyltransferase family 4 protein n=1 Tax=Ampullimonas aquatilis TaxID=1341549 RepID=UPI003C70EB4F